MCCAVRPLLHTAPNSWSSACWATGSRVPCFERGSRGAGAGRYGSRCPAPISPCSPLIRAVTVGQVETRHSAAGHVDRGVSTGQGAGRHGRLHLDPRVGNSSGVQPRQPPRRQRLRTGAWAARKQCREAYAACRVPMHAVGPTPPSPCLAPQVVRSSKELEYGACLRAGGPQGFPHARARGSATHSWTSLCEQRACACRRLPLTVQTAPT